MPSPFEGVSDFFSELARMRQVGRPVMTGVSEHDADACDGLGSGDRHLRPRRRPGHARRARRRASGGRRHHVLPGHADGGGRAPHGARRRRRRQLLRARAPLRRVQALDHASAGTSESDISAEFIDGLAEITVAGACRRPSRAGSSFGTSPGSRPGARSADSSGPPAWARPDRLPPTSEPCARAEAGCCSSTEAGESAGCWSR